MKVRIQKINNHQGNHIVTYAVIMCPACKEEHHPIIHKADNRNYPVWGFNNDVNKPTFTPSLLVRYPVDGVDRICHSFITDGMIQFLGDCTHDLANQTVELLDIDLE